MSEQPDGVDGQPATEAEAGASTNAPSKSGCGGCLLLVVGFVALCVTCTTLTGGSEEEREPVARSESGEAAVSRSGFEAQGHLWPLTVDSGRLRCDASSVTFEAPGVGAFAVNGTALGRGDLPPIDPVWAAAPGIPGLKVSIGDLIDEGLALC